MEASPEGLLTTEEVAAALHVHPKQVYRLLRQGLPSHRLGSEWRFSRQEVMAWVKAAGATEPPSEASDSEAEARPSGAPSLIAANGDLAVEKLLLHLKVGGLLFGFVQADREGALELLRRGAILAAGCHGEGPPARLGGERMARIHLVAREVGLAASPGSKVPELKTLGRKRLASRPPSAGVRSLFDAHLAARHIDPVALHGRASLLSSHLEVACALARGEYDAGLVSRAWAARLALPFERLFVEPYGLLVRARDLGDARVVALCEIAQSEAFQIDARAVPGYDTSSAGDIRYDP